MPLIRFLQHPLGAPLFYTSPAGSFNFVLKVSTMLGLVIALPFILFHLIRFLEPALPVTIKKSLIVEVIFSSTLLAVMGMAFGYYIIMPTSLHFFSNYSTSVIKPLISADAYLSYVLSVLVTFAVLFQIPLIVLFINRIKPIPPRKLLRYQRHVIVGAFVLAVILPFTYDPITQFVMALPIVFLYYLSVILVWIANRKKVIVTAVVEDVEPEAVIPVVTAPQARPARRQGSGLWQTANGGLKPATILKTAVDVVKPGTISHRPLKLDALNSVKVTRYNLLDLSNPT